MKSTVFLALLAMVVLASCKYVSGKRIKGDGNITTQNRAVSGFTSIDAAGSGDVYLTQDSVYSVKVETDNNLQEYIEVYKEGNVLHIGSKDHSNPAPTKGIKIYVSAPAFEELDASGACNYISQSTISSAQKLSFSLSGSSDVNMQVKAPVVEVGSSGAGSITLRGQTKDFSVHGSGSTAIKCFDLLTENSKIQLSGSGEAEVYASVKLDISVSGAGDVKYKGGATVSQSISGAGSVKKAD